ncbi:integrase catalytic domain-containing protein [Trichonephila clavipes]|nr:integrase catalytic domain-containing protein [Trichonephila clavipes]
MRVRCLCSWLRGIEDVEIHHGIPYYRSEIIDSIFCYQLLDHDRCEQQYCDTINRNPGKNTELLITKHRNLVSSVLFLFLPSSRYFLFEHKIVDCRVGTVTFSSGEWRQQSVFQTGVKAGNEQKKSPLYADNSTEWYFSIIRNHKKAHANHLKCQLPKRSVEHCTNTKLADTHLIYGFSEGNSRTAERLYRERHSESGSQGTRSLSIEQIVLDAVRKNTSTSVRAVATAVRGTHRMEIGIGRGGKDVVWAGDCGRPKKHPDENVPRLPIELTMENRTPAWQASILLLKHRCGIIAPERKTLPTLYKQGNFRNFELWWHGLPWLQQAEQFINNTRDTLKKSGALETEELKKSEEYWIKEIQKETYVSEIIDLEKAQKVFISSRGITWKYIVERAPWWGGFYERLVKSAKDPLRNILRKTLLTFEELTTILVEIECIVNSRPLTYVTDDFSEPNPLTPLDCLQYGRKKHDYPLHFAKLANKVSNRESLIKVNNIKQLF